MINEITNTVVKKVRKGVWRMPRLTEAMKDVISCDKLRVITSFIASVSLGIRHTPFLTFFTTVFAISLT